MHTPGPWTTQPIGDETECNVLGARRELIATVSDNDARLIAAAPEMRRVLEGVVAHWIVECPASHPGGDGQCVHFICEAQRQARVLLARIDGKDGAPCSS